MQNGQKTDAALVCVIDDDERLRRAIVTVLGDAGFKTVDACDGDIGLKLVTERKPSVVITDIVMPNREGLETIQILKQKFPTLPVLAVSGSFNPGSVDYLE